MAKTATIIKTRSLRSPVFRLDGENVHHDGHSTGLLHLVRLVNPPQKWTAFGIIPLESDEKDRCCWANLDPVRKTPWVAPIWCLQASHFGCGKQVSGFFRADLGCRQGPSAVDMMPRSFCVYLIWPWGCITGTQVPRSPPQCWLWQCSSETKSTWVNWTVLSRHPCMLASVCGWKWANRSSGQKEEKKDSIPWL